MGEGVAAGLTHLAGQGGAERFVASVGEAVRLAFANAGMATTQPVASIGLGLTGTNAGTPESDLVRSLMPGIIAAQYMTIENDATTALFGAHDGGPGIIAISGTGSIVMGMNADGDRARAGGWGWLLGDEGSAVAIGRAGLRAALAEWDRSGPRTTATPLVLAQLGLVDFADVKRLVYAGGFGAAGFAALAASVSTASQQNDMISQRIIREEAIALAAQVVAVARRLKLVPAETHLAPMGGAFEHVFNLEQEFIHALAMLAPDALVHKPKYSALQGAILMAIKAIKS